MVWVEFVINLNLRCSYTKAKISFKEKQALILSNCGTISQCPIGRDFSALSIEAL